MPSLTLRRSAAAFLALLLALAGGPAAADELPTRVTGNDIVSGEIDPGGEFDEFEIELFPGDVLKAKVKDSGGIRGLLSSLSLALPDGNPAAGAVVKKNGTKKPSLTFAATTEGPHVLRLSSQAGDFSGSRGGYVLTLTVKHAKPAKGRFADPAGGTIAHRFAATANSLVTLKATTRKGALELTDLVGPDETSEPGFGAALKVATNGRTASAKKFPLTLGFGMYEVRGTYAPGSSVTVSVAVAHGDKRRKRSLLGEPRFEPGNKPFPEEGVVGTLIVVPGQNFTFVDEASGEDLFPRFWVGAFEVPRATITRPAGGTFVFPIPAGPLPREVCDITVENADGQRVRYEDAFTVVPPPTLTSITAIDGGAVVAGPGGGRRLRISGADLRPGTVVFFGTVPRLPEVTLPTRMDVIAPAHTPGEVVISVRDDDGQTAELPGTFTYVDVPFNRVQSSDPVFLQALGGETVTVTGADFGDDSVFTLDGVDADVTLLSGTQVRFVAPVHGAGTASFRVTGQLEQTSAIGIPVRGFEDVSDTHVPAPLTQTNHADGWRGVRVLTGDLDGDTYKDLVLLQVAPAAGSSVQRPRVRVLMGQSNGRFSDATTAWIPAVSGDEDWRARDGVLVDLDNDGDLDLALVTDGLVDSGDRSSLRLLRNDGSTNGFTDRTSAWAPASTTYGDVNQGVAIAAIGRDLVVAHNGYFTETVTTVIDQGDPSASPPIPPTIQMDTYVYPVLRVLRNTGNGTLQRAATALPDVNDDEVQQYQADAIAVGDVVGDSRVDIVLTRVSPPEQPSGTRHRALRVLQAQSDGTFTDVSASVLPAASAPEWMQGTQIALADVDDDLDLDLFLLSPTALTADGTSFQKALRLLVNSGGTFSAAGSGTFPDISTSIGTDYLQGSGIAVGDLDGLGGPEVVIVSTQAPISGERACRILRSAGSAWVDASAALAAPDSTHDDGRGLAVTLLDVELDGDRDLIVVRDESDEGVRNTRVFRNPRN